MSIVVDARNAAKDRKAVEVKGFTQSENTYHATLYMGAPPDTAAHDMGTAGDDKSLPQAYLVEQPRDATVPPHFHETDQFQVFVEGEAMFGKQTVKPLSVHYAGGHTPYGPIVTHDKSVHYFTLRAHWDPGGKPMPESRDLLRKGQQEHRFVEVKSDARQQSEQLLPVEESGLGVSLFTLRKGETRTLDFSRDGGGQYAIVVRGSVTHGDTSLASNSCLYRFAEEAALTLSAVDEDASVLLMQFPKPRSH